MHTIKTGIPHTDDDNFYQYYYGMTLDKCDHYLIDQSLSDNELEIYITTFDGLLYVKYQILTLKHFLNDVNFKIVFCDTNSHINPEASMRTKELCINENVAYIKMPHNKFQDVPCFSTKLGVDMNWVWRNCIKIRQPKYFGYLDQDCFLINHIWKYLKNYLDNKGMYGYVWPGIKDTSFDKKYWLVHIMNNFFSYDFMKDKDVDFRPYGHIGLDTGGCNYFSIFQYYNREDYLQTESYLSDFTNPEWAGIFRDFTLQDNEKWIHALNSTKIFTKHPKEREYKEVYLSGLLNGILLKDKIQ